MRKHVLLSMTAMAGTMLAVPNVSFAQTNQEAQVGGIEEIVVSSRRREESLQVVPMAIAAFSESMLQDQNIVRIEDIDDLVPNLRMNETERVNNSRIFIRGIGGGNTTQIFSSGVGQYVDGVYMPNSIGSYTTTFDMERVEVLRGPQGTLFGKNTTGGLINIVTKKPGPDAETRIEVGAGSHKAFETRLSMNQPLVEDKLFARVGMAFQTDDGYMKELNTGDGYGDRESRSYRAAVRWLPTDNWTIDISGNSTYEPRHAVGGKCEVLPGQGGTNNNRHNSGGGNAFGGGRNEACALTQSAGPREFYSDNRGFSHVEINGVVANAQWDSNGPMGVFDNVVVKSYVGYRRTYQKYSVDNDWSNADYQVRETDPMGGGTSAHSETAEFLIDTTSLDGRLDALIGYYYFRDRVTVEGSDCFSLFETVRGTGQTVECRQAGYTRFRSIPFNTTGAGASPYAGAQTPHERPSHSVFAHAKWEVLPKLTWDVGARYTYEKLHMRSMDWASTRTPAGFKHYLNDTTVQIFIEGTESWDAFTPMTSLSYAIEGAGVLDDGLLYGSVSTGFQSGGFNNELDVDLDLFSDFLAFDPEHVTAYEIGFKSTWADGRLRANVAAFYTDYKDKQESIGIDNSEGLLPADPNLTIFDNAAKVKIKGFEIESSFKPIDPLVIDFNLGYLHARYSSFPTFDFATGQQVDQSNIVLSTGQPPWTGNLSARYIFDMTDGSTITPRIGVYYENDVYRNATTNPVNAPGGRCYVPGTTKGHEKWDGRITWENADRDLQIALWATNLTNKTVYRTCAVSTGNGYATYTLEAPRRFGVQATFSW